MDLGEVSNVVGGDTDTQDNLAGTDSKASGEFRLPLVDGTFIVGVDDYVRSPHR